MFTHVSRRTILGIGLVLILAVSISFGSAANAAPKAYELIKWNEPESMVERLSADKYILPEGWKEATEGVDEIIFGNSGAMTADIATKINMMRFEELTGIKVTAIELAADVAYAKTLITLVSKDTNYHMPLVTTPITELRSYVAGGWLLPLDDLYPPEVEALYPAFSKVKIDGHYYCSPIMANGLLVFYRPSWLEKAGVAVPTSWEELYEAAKKCRIWAKQNMGEDYYGATFAGKIGALYSTYLCLIFSQGGDLYRDGNYQFLSPEWKNTFGYLVNLIREDIASDSALTYSHGDSPRMFGMGKAAFAIAAIGSFANVFPTEYPEIANDWAPLPSLRWSQSLPDEYQATVIDTNCGAISKYLDDKHTAAVMLFMDYLRSKEGTRNEIMVEGNETFFAAQYEDSDISKKVDWDLADRAADELNISHKAHRDTLGMANMRGLMIKYGQTPAYPAGFQRVKEEIVKQLFEAATGNVSVESACEAIQKVAEETLVD